MQPFYILQLSCYALNWYAALWHMIVHMTRLYTSLVTYARLHILTLVVSFYHDTSYISFITLLLTIILLCFISVIMLLLFALLCTNTFSLYTHSLGRFWQPWIRTSRVLDIFLYCSGVRVIVHSRGAGVPLFWFWYSCISLFLLLFFNSCISHLASIPFLISSGIMCSHYMYCCSDRWAIMIYIYTLFRLL